MSNPRAHLALLSEAAITHASAGRAYQAHHLWETHWKSSEDRTERQVLQGLIQRCAAAHNQAIATDDDGRAMAAVRQLKRANQKLRQYSLIAENLGLDPKWTPPVDEQISTTIDWPESIVSSPLECDGLLIAGGHGRRAGGPKALKSMQGQPMWRWQLEQMKRRGLNKLVAVLHPSAQIEPMMVDSLAIHTNPDAEMMHSIQAAVAQIKLEERPIFILPVDCPCPPRQVWAALAAEALRARMDGETYDAIRASCEGGGIKKTGHPVLISPELGAHLLSLDSDTARLDHVLRSCKSLRTVEVDSVAIFANHNRDGISR
ncbi:MAG TPA: hypothetical protein DCQ06_08875 [Myxococcales bacterium]|nr:hypothetical protein [Myxococcales bacterium]HAN31694.1 hypothetical protein [Myxococcales bacterium]